MATVFTTSDEGDNLESDGLVIPMVGIKNYPYTIIFNFSDDVPALLREDSTLQLRKGGYSLKVENNILMLFTWRILSKFTKENVNQLVNLAREGGPLSGTHQLISFSGKHSIPFVEIENGWYSIEILGGETLQDNRLELTFEFILKKTNSQEKGDIGTKFNFSLTSSEY